MTPAQELRAEAARSESEARRWASTAPALARLHAARAMLFARCATAAEIAGTWFEALTRHQEREDREAAAEDERAARLLAAYLPEAHIRELRLKAMWEAQTRGWTEREAKTGMRTTR